MSRWPGLLLWAVACKGGVEPRAPATPEPVASAAAPSGPLTFGPAVLPEVLQGVRMGMSRAELTRIRPRAYESRVRQGHFHEEIAPDLSAHYTFHHGRLYSILLRQDGRASEVVRLEAEARRRWGEPVTWMGGTLYRAPGMLVRIEADLGNLALEITDGRHLRSVEGRP